MIALKNQLWDLSCKIDSHGPVSISAPTMSQTEMFITRSTEKTMRKCLSNKMYLIKIWSALRLSNKKKNTVSKSLQIFQKLVIMNLKALNR